MYEGLLTVKFITSKNCFCILSSNNYKHLQNNFVKLLHNDNEIVYVSVAPASGSFDDQSFGVNSLYAKALGIEENSLVAISEVTKPPTINSVVISALDENDHYVLESLADNVQSTLLEQIRVLSNGQKFIIWIGKTIHVTVSVYNIKPISPGIIDNLTEVVIKPPEKKIKHISQNHKKEKTKNINNLTFDFLTEYNDKTESIILRVVSTKSIIAKITNLNLNNDFNVFITKHTNLNNLLNSCKDPKIYKLTLLTSEEEKFVFVKIFSLEDILNDFNNEDIIFISDSLMDYFTCDVGSRVLVEIYDGPIPDIKEIEICTKINYSLDITQSFQQYLADNCKEQSIILNPNIVINVCDNLKCFVRFQPPQAQFALINPDFVRDCKLIFIKENLPGNKNIEIDFLKNYSTEISNYRHIIDKSIFLLTHNLRVFTKMNNILITGKTGTGKTTVSEIISNEIKEFPYFIFTKTISCKTIKGKTVESLHKLFSTIFYELVHHQPSVLILDDIHILCEKIPDGDILAQQAVYFNRVSEMLQGLFQEFCEYNAVGILATTESISKLNKNIFATRGNHLFKNVFDIESLTRKDRIKLLEFFFSNYKLDVDLGKCVEKTESFVIQDMVDLANKTLFEVYQEDQTETTHQISQIHIESALKTVTETCLSNVNLHPPGEKNLDDIGGLKDSKKILIETMLWPAKYPELFSNAPLRLASGLLLYGPPGTGKTLLAGAAAKHCGLRLISIKGPELLSKYIGASEQAVRDVFQRAQSAKPCILFFDEFDSLAPRRGHDNTGVTDRVVNQFLTQLDGIESLSGVFVLAATSRPDLLDPALLRPGRLDIHIRCSLPDESSRLEILNALSKSLKFSSDVNLGEIACATDGFSGADLQALLYSAQLDSVKGLVEDEMNIQEFQIEIHQTQLLDSLKNTRPSLTKAEQKKYERIYHSFEGGSSSDFTPGSKATLA